jgi:hypothetical protein
VGDKPCIASASGQFLDGEVGVEVSLDCQFGVTVADILVVGDACFTSGAWARPAALVNLLPGATVDTGNFGAIVWRLLLNRGRGHFVKGMLR